MRPVRTATATGRPHEELADLVNAWVFEHTEGGRVIELDANYIGKLEQGSIRWPQDPNRRAGLRAVLGVATDAELGFRRPRRSRIMVRGVDRQHFIRGGLGASVAAAAGPAALLELLAPTQPTRVPSSVGLTNIAQVRATVEAFRGWDVRYGGGLMRDAAVAQLRYCAELLRCDPPAPSTPPATWATCATLPNPTPPSPRSPTSATASVPSSPPPDARFINRQHHLVP